MPKHRSILINSPTSNVFADVYAKNQRKMTCAWWSWHQHNHELFLAMNSDAKSHCSSRAGDGLRSWLKRNSIQLTFTIVMIRDNTYTVSGPITCMVTLFCGTQLLIMTFSPYDNRDILGPSMWWSHQLLESHIWSSQYCSWHADMIYFPAWICHDYVSVITNHSKKKSRQNKYTIVDENYWVKT